MVTFLISPPDLAAATSARAIFLRPAARHGSVGGSFIGSSRHGPGAPEPEGMMTNCAGTEAALPGPEAPEGMAVTIAGLGLPFPGPGAPGGIRTPDPLVRSQVLYPTELRAHTISCTVLPARSITPKRRPAGRPPGNPPYLRGITRTILQNIRGSAGRGRAGKDCSLPLKSGTRQACRTSPERLRPRLRRMRESF